MNNKNMLFDNLIWMETEETAKYLRVSVNSLRTKVCRGEIPHYKLGRSLRFKKAELDELLESSKNKGELYGN